MINISISIYLIGIKIPDYQQWLDFHTGPCFHVNSINKWASIWQFHDHYVSCQFQDSLKQVTLNRKVKLDSYFEKLSHVAHFQMICLYAAARIFSTFFFGVLLTWLHWLLCENERPWQPGVAAPPSPHHSPSTLKMKPVWVVADPTLVHRVRCKTKRLHADTLYYM